MFGPKITSSAEQPRKRARVVACADQDLPSTRLLVS